MTIEHEMKSSISTYSTDNKSKVLIDRLQIILRCCGSISLADWFMTDWQGEPEKNNPLFVFVIRQRIWFHFFQRMIGYDVLGICPCRWFCLTGMQFLLAVAKLMRLHPVLIANCKNLALILYIPKDAPKD